MTEVIIIFLLFALVHSITVTGWFKHSCKSLFGDTFMRVWYRALYNAVSLVTAVVAVALIRRVPDRSLWTAPSWLWLTMRATQVSGLAFGALAFQYLDTWEFMGFRQVWRFLTRKKIEGNIEGLSGKELVTGGVYGLVRHPMYLAGIVIFTFNPHVTVNGVTISVLADLYFLLGAFIEERRFLRTFGDRYREYRRRVPMLIPGLHPRRTG